MRQSHPPDPVCVNDIQDIAKSKLSSAVWEYYTTGADEQQTLERNVSIYDRVLLRPQVLRDVSNVDTRTTIFGKTYDFPIAIAPSAYQKLVGEGGEVALTRASHALGSNFILSSNATTSLEDVMSALPPRDASYPNPWFQLYFLRSREATARLIQRAEKAGYEALVLTVDTVVLGNRYHERKTPLTLPPGLRMANQDSVKAGGVSKGRLLLNARTAKEANQVMEEHGDLIVDASLSWEETIPWLRSQTTMKIILKGIMVGDDAAKAVEAGVDGIIVSNHGGRQLDGVPSTLEVLPEIVAAVDGRLPVMFDGGIHRGSDIFKAIALGADLCFIGRSALWGLAYNGQSGVETILHILERELSRTMALAGAKSVRHISRDMVGVARRNGFGIAKL
ncbi:FMN-dependent dehydrogenase [Fusarium flagelliforme]|uniref:Oxidase FUB9 n=1 Tax=Fusarium flagelliforme TaxID=2675880 RepID=A0A395N3H0_9HYPO|nr:FMN-dependent dehydrogenase [Fusarium flagelliforme]KAH7182570.1 FMN-dependent dehydrogenase [Fusarium flagelliforme]RFN54672.1 fmn-dependent dehydrogenase [Fusarium flagelliforme]